jgi:hypothetical protein
MTVAVQFVSCCCEKLLTEAGDSLGTQRNRNVRSWKPLPSNGSEYVTKLWAGRPRNWGPNPGRSKRFVSSRQCLDRFWGPTLLQ